jgi:hypothetical protein
MDTEDDNFRDGINACIHKGGTNSPTANLPMGTYRHTGVGNAAALTDYASADDVIDQKLLYYVDSGAADAMVITPSPAITAYAAGQRFCVKPAAANTGATTINVNGLGAKDVKTAAVGTLAANAILSTTVYDLTYDGTQFILTSPSALDLSVLSVTGGDGITATDTAGVFDIDLTDAAATTSNPIDISTGVVSLDISALTAFTAASDIAGADLIHVDDGGGGTNKAISWQNFGVPTTTDATTTPLSGADLTFANRLYLCSNASAITATIPANGSVAYPVGTVMGFYQAGVGQVTVAVTTDNLRAINGAKTQEQYATIYATKTAATEWTITGQSAS